jgi:hypothetical protein
MERNSWSDIHANIQRGRRLLFAGVAAAVVLLSLAYCREIYGVLGGLANEVQQTTNR